MPSHDPTRRRRTTRAFTLVEVALALGIAGFVLVGLIGAIPLASSVGQQSIAQSRAASIAGTIFTNFRASTFSTTPYLDAAPGAAATTAGPLLNLNKVSTGDSTTYYAYFDEVTTTAPASTTDERRLHFVTTAPGGFPAYQITLRFNNHPAGTLAPYQTTASPTDQHAQANAIEVSIYALAHPRDVYRFSSVIANRAE